MDNNRRKLELALEMKRRGHQFSPEEEAEIDAIANSFAPQNTQQVNDNPLTQELEGLSEGQKRVRAGINAFGQGVTMGFGDEIAARVRAIGDTTYEDELANVRGYQDALRKEAPKTSMVADIAGGGALALATGGMSKGLTGIKGAATLGAIEGGARGFGEGEGVVDRMQQAAFGAGIGGASGAAFKVMANQLAKLPKPKFIKARAAILDGKKGDNYISIPDSKKNLLIISEELADKGRRTNPENILQLGKEANDEIKSVLSKYTIDDIDKQGIIDRFNYKVSKDPDLIPEIGKIEKKMAGYFQMLDEAETPLDVHNLKVQANQMSQTAFKDLTKKSQPIAKAGAIFAKEIKNGMKDIKGISKPLSIQRAINDQIKSINKNWNKGGRIRPLGIDVTELTGLKIPVSSIRARVVDNIYLDLTQFSHRIPNARLRELIRKVDKNNLATLIAIHNKVVKEYPEYAEMVKQKESSKQPYNTIGTPGEQ